MSMADKETRQRLYKEYIELDDKYRKLLEKLKPFVGTSNNISEFKQLVLVGGKLETKLRELQEALGAKRTY